MISLISLTAAHSPIFFFKVCFFCLSWALPEVRAETQSPCCGDVLQSSCRQVRRAPSYLKSLDFVLCAVEIVNVVVGSALTGAICVWQPKCCLRAPGNWKAFCPDLPDGEAHSCHFLPKTLLSSKSYWGAN